MLANEIVDIISKYLDKNVCIETTQNLIIEILKILKIKSHGYWSNNVIQQSVKRAVNESFNFGKIRVTQFSDRTSGFMIFNYTMLVFLNDNGLFTVDIYNLHDENVRNELIPNLDSILDDYSNPLKYYDFALLLFDYAPNLEIQSYVDLMSNRSNIKSARH